MSEAKAMAAEVVKALRDGPVHAAVLKAMASGETSVEIWSESAAKLYVSVMADELHKLGIWIYYFTGTQTSRRGSGTGYDSDGEIETIETTKIYLRPATKPK